ncbi:acetylornithine deacetylase [Roseivivax halodurans JCM 10272]|uniref:Acetylornithine deacetylase n=1 Tax=Roseivivax halodurans JCM 10272 TaxID=1449350 RepID=X7EHP7_9RHOB|nr:acetylornithine deacetylase [Roseivivax halodurans]ETX15634.1 acetylornithine deacetylase [Roseivivax halodurans JCM 10272]
MPERLSPRAILERLVAFPTVSHASNLDLIDWVESYLAGHGITAHRHWNEVGDKAALYAHVGPEVEGGVILSGHSDVVPVEGQDWSSDPWQVTERDGKLYGRGTTDMKGFDALAIWALVEARHAGIERPLQLALSYDEEVGCTGAPPLIAAMSGLPRASAVIVGEPTGLSPVTGHKGGVTYKVHVQGFEVHSSILHRGVSAIMWGTKLIEWANGVNDANLAATPGPLAAAFDPPCTNLHVGQIRGGTAHNITAKYCTFGLGARVVPGETLDQWRGKIEAAAREIEGRMQAVRPEARIAMAETFSLPVFVPEENGEAERLVRRITGENGPAGAVSFGTEASHFQAAGYSAVVCGPGDIAVAHQPDEYITQAQFQAGEAFMTRLVETLSG